MKRLALAAATTLAACTTSGATPPEPPTTLPPTAAPPATEPPAAPPLPSAVTVPPVTAGGAGATSPPVPDQALPGDESVGAVLTTAQRQAENTARVSWYGAESGSRTADGTPFDGSQMVFAHRSMAFGTLVRFCGPLGCVVARCADRGPLIGGRLFDLSRAAFETVAPLSSGVATVTWGLA